MDNQIKFLKSKYKLHTTSYIYSVGDSEDKLIVRFSSLYFKIVKDDKYIIIQIL